MLCRPGSHTVLSSVQQSKMPWLLLFCTPLQLFLLISRMKLIPFSILLENWEVFGETYLLLSPRGGAWLCQGGHLAQGCTRAAGDINTSSSPLAKGLELHHSAMKAGPPVLLMYPVLVSCQCPGPVCPGKTHPLRNGIVFHHGKQSFITLVCIITSYA